MIFENSIKSIYKITIKNTFIGNITFYTVNKRLISKRLIVNIMYLQNEILPAILRFASAKIRATLKYVIVIAISKRGIAGIPRFGLTRINFKIFNFGYLFISLNFFLCQINFVNYLSITNVLS